MKRALVVVVLGSLAAAGALVPRPPAASTGQPPPLRSAPVSVCSVEQGSGRLTDIAIVSPVNGQGRFTTFVSGTALGMTDFHTGASGSAVIEATEISSVGLVAGLAEVPDPDTGVAAIVTGPESLAAEICPVIPRPLTILLGGSTLSGQELEIHLVNPYAGEAAVRLTAVSEVGIEANDALDAIVIPSRSSAVVDLADLLPGREILSIVVEVARGSVFAIGRFSDGIDTAVWNAMEPAQDMYLLSPDVSESGVVTIATSSAADVTYQVDIYSADGTTEGFFEGVLPARGVATLDLSEVTAGAAGVRLIATAPIAAALRYAPGDGIGMTSAMQLPATRWMMPGAGLEPDSQTVVYLLNPGTEDATVTVTERRSSSTAQDFIVPADTITLYEGSGVVARGYVIDSDTPIVAMWQVNRDLSVAISLGLPVVDE